MTLEQAQKECERLFSLGIDAIPVIAVYGKTDNEHVYTIKHVGYFRIP